MTCRGYGISRQVSTPGTGATRPKAWRPQQCPHETPSEVVTKIIYLRTSYRFGRCRVPRVTRVARTQPLQCPRDKPGFHAKGAGHESP